jgi:hypothetical protein
VDIRNTPHLIIRCDANYNGTHDAGCKQAYGCHINVHHIFLIKADILFAAIGFVEQKIYDKQVLQSKDRWRQEGWI